MVADAGSAVVEGGRAIALPNSAALGSNLGGKLVESEELAIWGKNLGDSEEQGSDYQLL